MKANQMERNDAINQHFSGCRTMEVRQTKRGWIQQYLFGCKAPAEFKWFDTTDGRQEQIASSLEESGFCDRYCCGGRHSFSMVVRNQGSNSEILTMDRPLACNAYVCKCCCYQKMTYSYEGEHLGEMEELFSCCIPKMQIKDASNQPIYKVHPPTCCYGMCIDCCAEGNPCFGRGCCKVPFHIFPASQKDTDNGAPEVGKIVKEPKSCMVEICTYSEAFKIEFPDDATSEQKAMIAGSSILINANFFEEKSLY
jgi:hypothetical protein